VKGTRGLCCQWAVREFGMRNTKIGKGLGISKPAIGYAVGGT
jgi:hypothetical protein